MIFKIPDGKARDRMQDFENEYSKIYDEMVTEANIPEDWTETTPQEVKNRLKNARVQKFMDKLAELSAKEAAFLDELDRERYERATGGDPARILADAKEQAKEGILYAYAWTIMFSTNKNIEMLKERKAKGMEPIIYSVRDYREQAFFVDRSAFMDAVRKRDFSKDTPLFLLENESLAVYIVHWVINLHVQDLKDTGNIFTLEKAIGRILEKSPYTAGKLPAGWLSDLIPQALELPGFSNIPTGPALNYMNEVLIYGGDVKALAGRKESTSHGATLAKPYESDNKAYIHFRATSSNIDIGISDIEKLAGNNKSTKKIFTLALSKINSQALNNGVLTRDYVTFPLEELVNKGIYKTSKTARKGFSDAMDALTSMKIKGTVSNGKETSSIKALEVLFTGAWIKGNQCFIRLNAALGWNFIAQYFTFLPDYYYGLTNRAADLLFYIFYLARQNTDGIKSKGKFTISFRALQARLNLPDETGLNNPQRDIKDAIENAIDEIEEAHSRAFNNTEFALLPVCSPTGPIKEYLDNGYLEIGFSGKYAADFVSFSEATSKKIESQRKRRERIQDKAAAIHEARKLDAQGDA